MTPLTVRLIGGAVLSAALLFSPSLSAHDEWAWIQDFKRFNNLPLSEKNNCCDKDDASPIPDWKANRLKKGSVIFYPFKTGTYRVEIIQIYPTLDPEGRSWITKWGCLFRKPMI